jgi:low temperature requirement protein LtrA
MKKVLVGASIIAALFCFVAAAGGQPYSFYTLTRFVVFLVSCFGFYVTHELMPKGLKVGFVVIAVLFNPLIPFHLKRDTWQIVDILTGVALMWMPFQVKGNTQK